MLPHKTSRSLSRTTEFSFWLSWFVWVALFVSICGFAYAGDAVETTQAAALESGAGSGGVASAFELVYQGKFTKAGEVVKTLSAQDNTALAARAIDEILSDYQGIDQRRQSQRQQAYLEQAAKLEEFAAKDGIDALTDVNEPNDVNDVNDVSSVMLVVTNACEFADDEQKQQLLSKPFVKQLLQERLDEAAKFESEGKWLDSYVNCYSWLQAIYPDNESYEEYSEQLIEKANIVASFQDSPCETSKQRYEGVRKKSFVRAVDALQYNYVSIVNYRQMAVKAVKRCELLAEVISVSYSQILESKTGLFSDGGTEQFYKRPDARRLANWWAGLAVILNEVNQSPTGVSKDKFLDVFEKVLELNTKTVQLPETVLIAQFSEAALTSLDPHTVMIWPRQVEDFEKLMTNEFTGVGIEISKQKGLLTVASLLPDTPAYSSGLDAGDIIEAADGIPTKDMSLTCAVKKITGPKGTDVTLTVRTPGEEKSRDITITRDRIIVPTIRGWQRTDHGSWRHFIDDRNKIGYIRVTSFSDKTTDDLEQILDLLEAQGLKGLILDLRFNVGGLLPSAIKISDKFLKDGRIVSTHPRFGINSFAKARSGNTHPDYPLVVLINFTSASASEIVSGALQDPVHKRAVLVGERTHGKGSVQVITHYPQGGAQLKYTMAYYHLPSGQRVESREAVKAEGRDDWGVGPDIKVELTSDELKKMIDVQRDNDVLVKAGRNNGPGTEQKRHDAAEVLEADPQLAVAVLVVRAKLVQAALSM